MTFEKCDPGGQTPGKNTVNKLRFVLDSNIIISHLNHGLNIDDFFADKPNCEKCISVVTRIEALAKPNSTPEQVRDARDLLARFIQVDIFGPIINETAAILRRKMLNFPDAIIAATAIMLNATVLSNDPHLRDFSWPGYTAQPVS
jgi:predicted nucleic acid-binding protein